MRSLLQCGSVLLVTLVVVSPGLVPAGATTYLVKPDGTGDHPTIQAALDAAELFDLILLADGVFRGDGNRDLDYRGKGIHVRGESGTPESCIIDCEGSAAAPHRGVHFHSGEDAGADLCDVTIRNGWVAEPDRGGAILCEAGSSPILMGCVFRDNRSSAVGCIDESHPKIASSIFEDNHGLAGGALVCYNSSPLVRECTFLRNSAEWSGGAVFAETDAVPEFDACEFRENTAADGGGACLFLGSRPPSFFRCGFFGNSTPGPAGAVWLFAASTATQFDGCTFAGNTSGHRGTITLSKTCSATLEGCTFYANTTGFGGTLSYESSCRFEVENSILAFAPQGSAVYGEWGEAVFTCCDIFGNVGGDWTGAISGQLGIDGNISADPLFVDPAAEDLRLMPNSPCAPFTPPNPECDLIGAWPALASGSVSAPLLVPATWGRIREAFGARR